MSEQSHWTFETLKEHFDSLRKADREAIALALSATQEAISKAEHAQELRNAAANEFRGALTDQAARLITREEVNHRIDSVDTKASEALEQVSTRFNRMDIQLTQKLEKEVFDNNQSARRAEEVIDRRFRSQLFLGIMLSLFSAIVSVFISLSKN